MLADTTLVARQSGSFPLSQSAVARTDRPVGRDQFPGTTTQLFAKKVLSLETTNELSPNLRT